MREVWRLLEEHRDFIGEHTLTYLTLQEGPERDGMPLPTGLDLPGQIGAAEPWQGLLSLLMEALRLALRDDPALCRDTQVEAALQLQVAELTARARLAGCTLERLLRWCKCARRACAELTLLSALPASAKPAAARTLERGFDAIELALVAVWEREHGTLSEALSDRQILQAIHYPVLLVDAEGRLHWLNGAAQTLWRTTTLVASPEQQPRNLADVLPDLAKPWERICDAAAHRASRCRFEQPLDTLAGRRWFEVVAWPVAPIAVGRACVALFLRDITRERSAWSAGENGLLSRAAC